MWASRESRIEHVETRIDEFMPVWQFGELHSIEIAASPARTFEAMKAVTAGEIFLFRLLTWIRRGGRRSTESILRKPAGSRATLSPSIFKATLPPGHTIAAMNFLVTPTASGGSRVSTETRVFANSPAARRAFGNYWKVIYPGSALIRRMWLRAINRRATRIAVDL